MNGSRLTFVFENVGSMADFVISKWKDISTEAIRSRGFFTVALSGGKTPVEVYRRLAAEGKALLWYKTYIFFVDERLVPNTDADSNYRMIKETLLDDAGVPLGNIHAIPTDIADPVTAAGRYEKDISLFFGLKDGGIPEFDLVMLGIGADGHTASLFPGSPALSEKKRLVAAVAPGGDRHDRITLTLPVLNKAKNVIFLVTGGEKAEVLKEVMEGGNISLPASMVAPEGGVLLYLADANAGFLLKEEGEKEI